MFKQTLFLCALVALGVAIDIMEHPKNDYPPFYHADDVSKLLDEYLSYLDKFRKDTGDIELDFGDISFKNVSLSVDAVKNELQAVQDPLLLKALQKTKSTISVSINCTGGRLGDLSTLERSGEALESDDLIGVFYGQDWLWLKSDYILGKMYVKYPQCQFTIANVPYEGNVALKANRNKFSAFLVLQLDDPQCSWYDDYSNVLELQLTPTVKGTPVDHLLVRIIEIATEQFPARMKDLANSKLTEAVNRALSSTDACKMIGQKLEKMKVEKGKACQKQKHSSRRRKC